MASKKVETVFFASRSPQGVKGFASMTLDWHYNPKVYDERVVEYLLEFLKKSFGNLPFKVYVDAKDNTRQEADQNTQGTSPTALVLTAVPGEARPTKQTKLAWRAFAQSLLASNEVRLSFGIYSAAQQVAAAIRKSPTVEAAQTTWQLLGRKDLFHRSCIKALASVMSAQVLTLALDYLSAERAKPDEMLEVVFSALDCLCPQDLLLSEIGATCVRHILTHAEGSCFVSELLLRVVKSTTFKLSHKSFDKPTDEPKVESNVESKVVSKDESKVEPKDGPKVELKDEPKVEPKVEPGDEPSDEKKRALQDILNEFVKSAKLTVLANSGLVTIMLDLKPDFLFCGVCEVYANKLEEFVHIALRSQFADKAFFESFFSKFFPQDGMTLASTECVRHEVQHNPGLFEFMPAWLARLVLTREFVEANMHDVRVPVELLSLWDEKNPDFDEAFVKRLVWLDLGRFVKAPTCVQKDHDLGIAVLVGGHIHFESLGPCWDDEDFVQRAIDVVGPQSMLYATNLTRSLVVSAFNVARQLAGAKLDLLHRMACKASQTFGGDVVLATSCLLSPIVVTSQALPDIQRYNSFVVYLFMDEDKCITNHQAACYCARMVTLDCAGSRIFTGFHGDKQFASACIDNLTMSLSARQAPRPKCYHVSEAVITKCLGVLSQDLDFAISTLGRLGKTWFSRFFPTLANNTIVLKILDQHKLDNLFDE